MVGAHGSGAQRVRTCSLKGNLSEECTQHLKGGQKKLGRAARADLKWVPKVITEDSNYRET